MINKYNSAYRQVIINPPKDITLGESSKNFGEKYLSEDYEIFALQYNGDLLDAIRKIDYAEAFILSPNIAVIAVLKGKQQQLLKDIEGITISESSNTYFLTALSPINTANISIYHDNPYLNLRGTGVIVGMIDSGIDYLNEEFMTEDDKTRIISIWDQTSIQGSPPNNFPYGTEYTREQINLAIDAKKKGQDPYAIVNSRDEIGHGTADAGIIAARGRGVVVGGAPDCEIIMVKLKQAKTSTILANGIFDVEQARPIYETNDIIFGIAYLLQMQTQLNKPMCVFIPLGSNSGGHDGSSVLEKVIDAISQRRGVVAVTGVGNQGAAENHASGTLQRTGDINTVEVNVDPAQKGMAFVIYATKPDKFSVGIVSPSGESVEKVPIKLNEVYVYKFTYEESTVTISYFFPEINTGDTYARITIDNIKGGIWQFKIYGDYIVNGRYDIWTYSKKLLKPQTRFLNPDPLITIQLPATSKLAIVSAVYNQDINTLDPQSGRGFTRDGRIKPDISSGGFEVLTTAVGGGTTVVSGSSPASAVLASAVILLLQWGIVNGNDPSMYSEKVRTYLIRGARRRPGDTYPNPEWGFGILDLEGTFNNIRNQQLEKTVATGYFQGSTIEVLSNNLYFNIPHELVKNMNYMETMI